MEEHTASIFNPDIVDIMLLQNICIQAEVFTVHLPRTPPSVSSIYHMFPTCIFKPLCCGLRSTCFFSGRSPAASVSKKHKSEEEPDDLTKEMEEPPPEPNIQEVTVPKPGMLNYFNTRSSCICKGPRSSCFLLFCS
jgi:hypothetical protein